MASDSGTGVLQGVAILGVVAGLAGGAYSGYCKARAIPIETFNQVLTVLPIIIIVLLGVFIKAQADEQGAGGSAPQIAGIAGCLGTIISCVSIGIGFGLGYAFGRL